MLDAWEDEVTLPCSVKIREARTQPALVSDSSHSGATTKPRSISQRVISTKTKLSTHEPVPHTSEAKSPSVE